MRRERGEVDRAGIGPALQRKAHRRPWYSRPWFSRPTGKGSDIDATLKANREALKAQGWPETTSTTKRVATSPPLKAVKGGKR